MYRKVSAIRPPSLAPSGSPPGRCSRNVLPSGGLTLSYGPTSKANCSKIFIGDTYLARCVNYGAKMNLCKSGVAFPMGGRLFKIGSKTKAFPGGT